MKPTQKDITGHIWNDTAAHLRHGRCQKVCSEMLFAIPLRLFTNEEQSTSLSYHAEMYVWYPYTALIVHATPRRRVLLVKHNAKVVMLRCLCNELNHTTSFLDLSLGILAEVSGANNERNALWKTSLAENFAVAEWEEIEDRCGVAALVGEELLSLFEWDEGPELGSVRFCDMITDSLYGPSPS